MAEENIDEIIQEILSEEKKVEEGEEEEIIPAEELYECPVCHHQVSENADFCPYCFAVFDENVDYKMLLETLIKKLKFLIPVANEIKVPMDVVNQHIKEAKKYAARQDYPSGYAHLHDAYFYIIKEIVEYYKREMDKYEIMMGVNSEIRDMYGKANAYLEDWDIENFMPAFDELKKRAETLSKDLRQYLEKLESVENAIHIARKFGINTESAENVVDTAKDIADNRKYTDAVKVLDEALTPIKDDIEEVMGSFLSLVKEEVMRSTYSGKSNAKNIIRLVREMKIYRDEGNLVKVLEKMEEISNEMSMKNQE